MTVLLRTLILIRHASAESFPSFSGGGDFRRRLTPRGIREAEKNAFRLRMALSETERTAAPPAATPHGGMLLPADPQNSGSTPCNGRGNGNKRAGNREEERLIFSSPALRALETAEIFGRELGFTPGEIAAMREIYGGDADTLRDLLEQTGKEVTTVLLFGHNPAVSILASGLCPGLSDAFFPPGTVAGMSFASENWRLPRSLQMKKRFYLVPDAVLS